MNSQKSRNKSARSIMPVLLEGDYYFNEDGLMVFTAQYHLRRGYCCGNQCRHCPYTMAQTRQSVKEEIKKVL